MTATIRMTSPLTPANLIAPDTSGLNFYRADPALTDLLKLHLPEALFRHIEPYLNQGAAEVRPHEILLAEDGTVAVEATIFGPTPATTACWRDSAPTAVS